MFDSSFWVGQPRATSNENCIVSRADGPPDFAGACPTACYDFRFLCFVDIRDRTGSFPRRHLDDLQPKRPIAPRRLPEGRLHSLEFRPRSGQPGVYEADYIVVSSDSVIEFGSITLNLPTEDGDTNGIPDLLQFNRAVDAAISGHVEPDYVRDSRVTRENFTGTLR